MHQYFLLVCKQIFVSYSRNLSSDSWAMALSSSRSAGHLGREQERICLTAMWNFAYHQGNGLRWKIPWFQWQPKPRKRHQDTNRSLVGNLRPMWKMDMACSHWAKSGTRVVGRGRMRSPSWRVGVIILPDCLVSTCRKSGWCSLQWAEEGRVQWGKLIFSINPDLFCHLSPQNFAKSNWLMMTSCLFVVIVIYNFPEHCLCQWL